MRKHLLIAGMALLALGCGNNDNESPAEAPKRVLIEALDALKDNNIDSYLSHTDMSQESSQCTDAMRQVIAMHLARQQAEMPTIVAIDIIDADMQSDTICTLYYQYTFANRTKEVLSQKMARLNGQWLIKLRE